MTDDMNGSTLPPNKRKKRNNKPDAVRSSFIRYLKKEFPYGEPWVHPYTKDVYSSTLIRKVLKEYQHHNALSYRALWALWTTQAPRSFIADSFNFSGSSLKRLWNDGIDYIMLRLYYPELAPEVPLKLTGWSHD